MIDLKSLLVFAHVAESLSYSAAARRLVMPVSTVSRRIAELEKQLGVTVLQRSTRNLRLTAAGLEVLDLARHTIEITKGVEDIVASHHAEPSGTVRFAAPPSISEEILMPIITAFQDVHPRVRFEVVITEQVVDYIGDRIDLEVHVGPIANEALVVRRLLTFRHLLVASPDYLGRVLTPLHPRDLLAHKVLAFSHSEPELVWHFEHVNGRNTEHVALRPSLAINDYAGIIAGLLAGSGIGDLPPIVRPDLVRDGRLVPVMPDWRFPAFDLVLIHPASRYQPRAVRLFKDFVARSIINLFPELVY